MKEFSYLFKDDALWGEQEVIRFRWVLIAAILLMIGYIFASGNIDRGLVSLALAGFYIFYNSIVNVLLKKVGNAVWIRYLSTVIDISVLSLHIFNYSLFFAPIAVVTAASTFLYSILIMLSVLRYDGRLVIFSSLYVVFCYNLIYILRRPYFDPTLIDQVPSADWDGQLFKSIYFLLMGYFLFSIPRMVNRLVKKQGVVIDERKSMELKLALEQQKRDLAIQKLQMEKKLNKQLSDQKELIEQQKKVLEDLNATKDKLFSIIGHDLRSPFSAQCSLSELLIDDFDNFSKKELIDSLTAINRSATNGMNLLSNLLDWAKTQNIEGASSPIQVNVTSLIAESLEVLSNNIRNKQLKVVNNVSPNLIIIADENMIKTIFRNLLSNAIKYSYPNSEIVIESNESMGYVSIDVIDKGIGIEADRVKSLFSIQRSMSTPGTENEVGTGLGLILCKELAEKNKGKIEVASKSGEGSRFSLKLPILTHLMN